MALGIALIWGTFIGLTYSYKSLFAGNWKLFPLLIWPSVLIGLMSGWKTILNCLIMYLTTAALLYTRAIAGRNPDGEYFTFAFKLTFGSVADVIPIALFWAYIATIVVSSVIYSIRKKKPQQGSYG